MIVCCVACSRACSLTRTLPARRRAWTDRASAGTGVRCAGSAQAGGIAAPDTARQTGTAGRSYRQSLFAGGPRLGRVALFSGCINPVLAPSTIEATIRLLNRQGIEVVIAAGEGCCGSLVHHMGREDEALSRLAIILMHGTKRSKGRALMPSWSPFPGVAHHQGLRVHAAQRSGLCGQGGARFVSRARRQRVPRDPQAGGCARPVPLTIAYHAACSLQHGQKVLREPKELLAGPGSW